MHINVVTSFAIDSTHSVALQQDFFDKVFPNILPMAYTLLMYYLRVKSASGAVNRRDVCSFYCLFCIRHFVNGTRHRVWRCLFLEFHPVQTLQQIENYTALSERASEYLLAVIRRKPDAVICGDRSHAITDVSLSGRKIHQQQVDVSQLTFVKLDEWVDLPLTMHGTCETFLQQHIDAAAGAT